MIERFLTLAADPAAEADLRREVADFIASLKASAGHGDRSQVRAAEDDVRADPGKAFTFDAAGHATLAAACGRWQAGRFETPAIAELREWARGRGQDSAGGEVRLWVLDGASPATDIGGLQATAGGRALFQVASQFNCLESPGPFVVPVADYFHDFTQGPRASISAFPATLLRHYAAPDPDGGPFVQRTGGPQIDLLADVFPPGKSPVRDGYLLDHGCMGAQALVSALEAGFDRIRVGVHDAAQVVLGHDWDGAVEDSDRRRVSQVFTSTVAGGGYGGQGTLAAAFEPACRQTLRAAYLGTLLAAAALGRTPAVLTLVGGGVFGNPVGLIWEAILAAFDEVRPLAAGPLDVVLNGYNLGGLLKRQGVPPGKVTADVRDRGGAVLRFGVQGLAEVRR